MRNYQAIIVAGLFIAVFVGGAIMWVNRYEITQPLDPELFRRYDRWTGQVELCSSYYDEKTYCGVELKRRVDRAREQEPAAQAAKVKLQHDLANVTFCSLGYSQDQIDNWPKEILEGARNAQNRDGRGSGREETVKFLKAQNVSPPVNPARLPTVEELLNPKPCK